LERQFGGGRVDDLGAGVDPDLDGVGPHELLAEAVDRGAGDLVEGLRTTLDAFALGSADRPAGSASRSSLGMVPPSNSPANRSMRSRSSLAAASVKVIATMSLGGTPAVSSIATRPAMSAVLPLPAPASTSRE